VLRFRYARASREAVIPAALKAGASLAGVVLCLGSSPGRAAIPTVEECLQRLREDPRSFEPYRCFGMSNDAARRARVLRVLETLKRQRPTDGRPVFWSALIRENAGEPVPEREFEEAAEKFAAEGHVPGQVSALVALACDRCFARAICDQRAEDLLARAEQLAESSRDLCSTQPICSWMRFPSSPWR
jgi:hypothetical protein